MRLIGALYVAVVLLSVGVFALRDPDVLTPTIASARVPPRGDLTNLADFRSGARLRVNNYDVFRGHHPLFAIDGETHPTTEEKWASLPGSPPFLEVILPGRADLRRVRLTLGGAFEPAAYTSRDFDLICVRDVAEVGRVSLRNNLEARPDVLLGCPSTDQVRVEFVPAPPPLDRARVYEIEVWGLLE